MFGHGPVPKNVMVFSPDQRLPTECHLSAENRDWFEFPVAKTQISLICHLLQIQQNRVKRLRVSDYCCKPNYMMPGCETHMSYRARNGDLYSAFVVNWFARAM